MTELFTHDPQFDALLRQVAGVSVAGTQSKRSEPPLPPQFQMGPYRLIEVVGVGGMGVVYRAFDERLTREVALKLLPKQAQATGQLLDEARAAASLSHPHLASIYEAGTIDGRDYFAMELVRGASLRTHLSTGAGSRTERLTWALGLARGLAAIHSAGWVHGDVKPENVMVTHEGVTKLLDLGLARPTQAAPFSIAGTPGYMAPEQERGEPLDARSDVWALGQVLDELGVGARITRRCLEPQRARRFASATDVARALESARRTSVWWPVGMVVLLATALLLAGLSLRPETSTPRFGPARRLTGHARSRPFSDAAISHDGRTFGYVDDDGLFLGDTERPERLERVALEEIPLALEASRSGFVVLTSQNSTERALWNIAGPQHTKLLSGQWKFASANAQLNRSVNIEGSRVVVRRIPEGDELSAVSHSPQHALHAVRWSPSAELYALAYSERASDSLSRHLELWVPGGNRPVWALQTPRLSQGYVPVVFAFSASGALIYALADEPGEGSGSSVWSLDGPNTQPVLLTRVDGNVFRTLGLARDGALLALRESTHLRAQIADVAPNGALSNARSLGQSELDERPTGWESLNAVWVMAMRDFVPHLALRELGRSEAQWLDAKGWAQTWPVSTGRPGELLYWWAENVKTPLVWNLSLKQHTQEHPIEVPQPVTGQLSTLSPPPHTHRVRCATTTRLCVLARTQGALTEFYDLSLDGDPPVLRFSLPAPKTVGLVWALAREGQRIAVADVSAVIRVFDRNGKPVLERRVPGLREIRGVSFDSSETGHYVSGMRPDELQTVGWFPAEGTFSELQTEPSAFADLHLSPDRRTLVYVEKQFDADLWLTPRH